MKAKLFNGSRALAGLGIVIALSVPACLAPPFSEIQDARLVGQGAIELTPFASTVSASNEGETNHIQNDFGLQAGVGVLSFMDLRFRYEYMAADRDPGEDAYGVHVIGAGPKFSLVKNILAIYLPVGFAVGEDVEAADTWQFHPTLIATAPLGKGLSATLSAKALIPLQKDGNTLYAVNLGFGIAPGGGPVTLRPEAGILFDTEGSGFDFHLSLGLSFRIGR